jgi:hypothetical protein
VLKLRTFVFGFGKKFNGNVSGHQRQSPYTVVNGLTQAITVVKCKPSEVRSKVPTGDPKLEIRGTLKRSKVQRDKTEDMMALKDSRREISMREAISAFGNHSCASNM